MYRQVKSLFTALALAIAATAILAASAQQTVTHKVKKGETIYGISKSYGISIDQLIEMNPAARDGLKTGQVLTLPAEGADTQESAKSVKPADNSESVDNPQARKTYHTIARGETLYSIAKTYGMDLDQLMALNPGVDTARYQPGTVLRLTAKTAAPARTATAPAKTATPAAATAQSAPVAMTEPILATPSPTVKGPIPYDPNALNSDTPAKHLSIAVILPFMLNETTASKQANLYTEFLKGFMLAADTLSHRGAAVDIYAYDSASSLDTVKSILRRPEFKTMSVILAPDDAPQLAAIAEAAKQNSTFVYNAFSIKDESYTSNPWMMQANVPHDEMYDLAISNLISRFAGYTPVFLTHENGKNDKAEFTAELRKALKFKGIESVEIQYANSLTAADLKKLSTDTRYLFIPASASRSDFNKITSALKNFKGDDSTDDPDRVRLFGYPEWVTFRGEAFETLCQLNTTIYSRFYNDANGYRAKGLNESFSRWYGREMVDAVPSQGTLGFDTGYFLIRALRENDGDLSRRISPYDGIQSAFDFMAAYGDNAGMVNDALYFVYFRPGGFTDKVKL